MRAYIDELDNGLAELTGRARAKPGWGGVRLWTGMLGLITGDLRARNDEVYRELMRLEEDVQAGRDRAGLLERIGKAKGLLSVVFFALVLHAIALSAVGEGDAVRRSSGRVRVRREAVEV